MTVGVLSLAEFLLARIAEDEALARREWPNDYEAPHLRSCLLNAPEHTYVGEPYCDCGYPARVLAECEAKRRIVGSWIAGWSEPEDGYPSRPLGGEGGELYYDVLCHLAAVCADRPDYRAEWKP